MAKAWSKAQLAALFRFADKNSGPWDAIWQDEVYRAIPGEYEASVAAAAPLLLEALEQLVEQCEEAGWHKELLETAREAIKEAKNDQ